MAKIINVTAFVVTFALGVFLVYTLEPTKQQVWIYASPKKKDEVQFRNKQNKCYEPVFKAEKCTMFAQNVDSSPSFLANLNIV